VRTGCRGDFGHRIGQMPANAARANSAIGHRLAARPAEDSLRSAADAAGGEPILDVSRIIAYSAAQLEIDGTRASAAEFVKGRGGQAKIIRCAADCQRAIVFWCAHCFFRVG
jgi:hypothetical protein